MMVEFSRPSYIQALFPDDRIWPLEFRRVFTMALLSLFFVFFHLFLAAKLSHDMTSVSVSAHGYVSM